MKKILVTFILNIILVLSLSINAYAEASAWARNDINKAINNLGELESLMSASCVGLVSSAAIISTLFNVSIARKVISDKLPIGVETI